MKIRRNLVRLLGSGSLVVLFLFLLLFLHYENALVIWSFYIALSFLLFVVRPGWFNEDERMINIFYYGWTLFAQIVSAIGLKFIYYYNYGGFQRSISNFIELSTFMIFYAVMGLLVFFYIFYLYSRKAKSNQEEFN